MKRCIWILLALWAPSLAPARGLQDWGRSYVGIDDYAGETRMEFQFSFKYRLLDLALAPYFVYQCQYDFAYATRYSNPVFSRLQNPGLLLDAEPLSLPLRAGYFHESNGQDLGAFYDTDGGAGARAEMQARRAKLASAGLPEEWVMDGVSRAWDYWHFSYPWAGSWGPAWAWALSPELRLYTGKQTVVQKTEESTWWDPDAPAHYINQYDGLRLRSTLTWAYSGGCKPLDWLAFKHVALGLDLRSGYNGLGEHLSMGTDLELRFGELPIFAYYLAGYGPYISDYSTYHRSGGVGFRVSID